MANESTASEFTPTKNAWKQEDNDNMKGRIEEDYGGEQSKKKKAKKEKAPVKEVKA